MNGSINSIRLLYEKKPDTKASYYLKEGPSGILPNRLSIGGNLTPVRMTEKTRKAIAQIKGSYRKNEPGTYKHYNHGEITSSIFSKTEFPDFFGYAIIDERFRIFDLWIIRTSDAGESFELNLFKGLAYNEQEIESCFMNLITEEKK